MPEPLLSGDDAHAGGKAGAVAPAVATKPAAAAEAIVELRPRLAAAANKEAFESQAAAAPSVDGADDTAGPADVPTPTPQLVLCADGTPAEHEINDAQRKLEDARARAHEPRTKPRHAF